MADRKFEWFSKLRFGLFIHYGLYSLLGRGEWVMNREGIPCREYEKLMKEFTADKFNADEICDLAVSAGMRYIVFTTMHHEGFRLYNSKTSDFNSLKSPARRDLTAEIISAAKKRKLKIGLYHSLNNWHDSPDAVDALETKDNYNIFIKNTFERIRELAALYNPVDIMWYDGWWPFNAAEWKAIAMNRMVTEIQPHIIFNGRNGLPGDFSTPEGHISAPNPWRPWESCMTLNNSWGYHKYDDNWNSAKNVVGMLAKVAQGRGNLLLNVGPKGNGSLPEKAVKILAEVGKWLKMNGAAIYDADVFDYALMKRDGKRGDWCSHGPFTASGNYLYLIVMQWPGNNFVLNGLECTVKDIQILGHEDYKVIFSQANGKLEIVLPEKPISALCPVIRFRCDKPPAMYLTGGMRVPKVRHPHYDPCPSDIIV